MGKYIVIIAFFLTNSLISNIAGQTFQASIDSMLSAYEAETDAHKQVDLLNEISYAYRRLTPDSVMLYADRALALAKELEYKEGLAFGYKNKGIGFYKYGLASDTIIYYYQKAIYYAEQVNDYYTQAACYNNIGLVSIYELAYNEAIQYLLRGVAVFDQNILEENRLKALMLGNIATAYHRGGDNKRGIRYYEESLAMAERLGELTIPSIFVDELARARLEEGDIEGALRDIEMIMPLHDQIGDYESKTESLMTLSEVKMAMGLYTDIIEHAQEAMLIAQERGFSRLESKALIWLARGLRGKGDLEAAIVNAKQALAIADDGFSLLLQAEAAGLLGDIYADQQNYYQAYEYATLNHQLVKQEQDANRQRITDELEAKYQNEQQLLEINLLKEKQKQQQKRFYGLIAIVLLVLCILGGLIYAIRQKNRVTVTLNEKNLALQTVEQNLFEKNQELQRYIESNLQLENFAHLASHDLREPMRNIVSFSQLLAKSGKDKLNERELEYLGFIRQGTRRIEGLVKDLLDYSTITHSPLELTQVSLVEIINDVKRDISQLLAEEKGEITIKALPEVILADPSRLYQLMQNLLTNGLRYSAEGVKPEITISGEEGNTHYHFKVKDNGLGIEKEFHDQIFVLFKTLKNKSISNSSGIGLATCKKVVEDHQGKIWVESEVGEGSVFHFTIAKDLG